jgi:hypothetical protein
MRPRRCHRGNGPRKPQSITLGRSVALSCSAPPNKKPHCRQRGQLRGAAYSVSPALRSSRQVCPRGAGGRGRLSATSTCVSVAPPSMFSRRYRPLSGAGSPGRCSWLAVIHNDDAICGRRTDLDQLASPCSMPCCACLAAPGWTAGGRAGGPSPGVRPLRLGRRNEKEAPPLAAGRS